MGLVMMKGKKKEREVVMKMGKPKNKVLEWPLVSFVCLFALLDFAPYIGLVGH